VKTLSAASFATFVIAAAVRFVRALPSPSNAPNEPVEVDEPLILDVILM
jgi:hypothetical protein